MQPLTLTFFHSTARNFLHSRANARTRPHTRRTPFRRTLHTRPRMRLSRTHSAYIYLGATRISSLLSRYLVLTPLLFFNHGAALADRNGLWRAHEDTRVPVRCVRAGRILSSAL